MIYIVEDDSNILEIETYALSNSGFIVKGFENGESFLKQCEFELPQVVILDLMLPKMDGLEILTRLRSNPLYKDVLVLIVSAKSSEFDRVKGLDLGADDYLIKPFGVLEIVSRVKALIRRGETKKKVQTYEYKNILINEKAHIVLVDNHEITLTFKEYELLKYFIINQGIALSRELIQEKVWGTNAEIESRTIDIHINTLRKKINDLDGVKIKTIRNIGYKLGD